MSFALTFTSCVLKEGVMSQTLSYLCSDTCFSSYLSLLLRTLSVLPSLAARTSQSYLFYLHLSPAPVRPICSRGVTLVDYKRCALLIILWFWFPSWSSYLKLEILMDCYYTTGQVAAASQSIAKALRECARALRRYGKALFSARKRRSETRQGWLWSKTQELTA